MSEKSPQEQRSIENNYTVYQSEKQSKPKNETMSLLSEFIEFLGERKKFWLLPIVLVLLLLGALIVFTQTSVIAPFIYTLF